MRRVLLALGAIMLIGATSSDGSQRTPETQAKLDSWLAGRVAGKPMRCIAPDKTRSPIGIDDGTLLFRDGPASGATTCRPVRAARIYPDFELWDGRAIACGYAAESGCSSSTCPPAPLSAPASSATSSPTSAPNKGTRRNLSVSNP
ncbi:hypothetical protein [Sphingomonas daechungensis]|uniref:hypothetical protein n=1 Tax=Sphingomonas daechungensis TaxID=1176646 RepID=UPI001CB99318|nr:hypothetical protein [Sphingomonas daechungensis]